MIWVSSSTEYMIKRGSDSRSRGRASSPSCLPFPHCPSLQKNGDLSLLGLKFYFRKATRLTSSGYVRNDN